MNSSNKRILILGASGFIGGVLANHFKILRKDIHAAIRDKNNYGELDVPYLVFDLLGELPSFKYYDTIVYCATPNDISSRAEDGGLPLAVIGTHRFLNQAILDGVKKIIYFSTLQVYGTELLGEIDENTKTNCESLYGLNHYLGEEVCRFYTAKYPINIVVVRPSNVYGLPPLSNFKRNTLVPFCFVNEIVEKNEIILRSSGKQMRNFISTNELANKINYILENFPSGFTVYNLVSDWEASILDIAYMVSNSFYELRGHRPAVTITSNLPESSNIFKVKSLYIKNIISIDESQIIMQRTINDLITQKINKNA